MFQVTIYCYWRQIKKNPKNLMRTKQTFDRNQVAYNIKQPNPYML